LVIASLTFRSTDQLINNAGYFYEPEETIDTMNFKEQIKQIDICAVGPLRVAVAFLQADFLKKGSKIIMITSQGGSVEWRFTQNPKGHDYGHHVSERACLLTLSSQQKLFHATSRHTLTPTTML
jgi:NAD(P)-dependent dehydrogenase (short-subunit alcohol dehydrogenase family)